MTMDVLKLIILAVAAAVLSLTIKGYRPEIALTLSLAAAVILVVLCLGPLSSVVEFVERMADEAGITHEYMAAAIKVTGIALLCELGVQLCRDAGETAIASKLELGAKVMMLVIALPILKELLETVKELAR